MVPEPESKAPTMLDIKIAQLRRLPGVEARLAAEPGWDEMGEYCAKILDVIGTFPELSSTFAWATPRLMARITIVVRAWNEHDHVTRASVAWILNTFFHDWKKHRTLGGAE